MFVVLLVIDPTSHELGSPAKPGRFTSLFHRQASGVSLTVAGKAFLRRARAALKHIGNGSHDVAAIGRSEDGLVRIGFFSSLAAGFLPELIRIYAELHPAVRIEFREGSPLEQIASIRQLQIDIAFVTGVRHWPDCDTAQLWSERVFAVLPTQHSLVRKDEIGWHDLTQERFIVSDAAPGQEIHDYLIQRLADLGHHPEIHAQYVGRDNLLPLVALGRGLTLTSEATTATQVPGVTYKPIAGEILPFSAVWSPKNDNPALRRLLSLAKSISKTASV